MFSGCPVEPHALDRFDNHDNRSTKPWFGQYLIYKVPTLNTSLTKTLTNTIRPMFQNILNGFNIKIAIVEIKYINGYDLTTLF